MILVQIAHTLGAAVARGRLEPVADALMTRAWPGGVEVWEAHKQWSGDRLEFSCTIARGFFSAPISGHLAVDDTTATLAANVPGTVVALVGEDRIREALTRELEAVLLPA